MVLSSCAHEVGFNADYVSHALPESTTAGKLLIVMPQSERLAGYQKKGGTRIRISICAEDTG